MDKQYSGEKLLVIRLGTCSLIIYNSTQPKNTNKRH